MSPRDLPEDLTPTESGSVVSRPVLTPRGGFMARPGLKPPPTHAVVVRGGEAPLVPEIPAYRSSFLPPPPPSDPEALLSEKQTLRALPRQSAPAAELTPIPPSVTPHVAIPPPPTPVAFDSLRPVMESLPPPSDAPVVSNGSGAIPYPAPRQRSRWSIVAAAAVGLLFGVVSVAMTVGVREPAATVQAAPPVVIVQPAPAPAEAKAAGAPVASAEPLEPAASAKPRATEPRAPRVATPPKQSIF